MSIQAENGEPVSDSDDTKSTFEIIARSPHAWLMAAKQLKRAADLIRQELTKVLAVYPRRRAHYEDLARFKSYRLLSGLAIENLVKGILGGRNPGVVSPDKFDLSRIACSKGGHDLLKLAQQAAPTLSDDERDILARLATFVIWAGKYPIHLRSTETVHPSFVSTDPELVDKLFTKFVAILEQENPTPDVGFV